MILRTASAPGRLGSTQNRYHLRYRRSGFTLLELLVVIGIILLLVSILLPTVYQVRISVQTASTRQTISRMEAGISAYFSEFQAYPGPVPRGQLMPFAAAGAIPPVTSTENLYLALCGGLKVSTTGVISYDTDVAQNQNGPGNLNVNNIRRYDKFIAVKEYETTLVTRNPSISTPTAGQWNPPSGTFVGDTVVPEIVDGYAQACPILYMRAQRGANGFVDGGTAINTGVQYQPSTIMYTYAGITQAKNAPWKINNATTQFPKDSSLDSGLDGAFKYFGNPDLSTTTAVPFQKDNFILISAGADGKFGTRDDITNYRTN